ncbi:MAG: mercury resistance system transport protein MerF [Alphaproteobacteria bacterium]
MKEPTLLRTGLMARLLSRSAASRLFYRSCTQMPLVGVVGQLVLVFLPALAVFAGITIFVLWRKKRTI